MKMEHATNLIQHPSHKPPADQIYLTCSNRVYWLALLTKKITLGKLAKILITCVFIRVHEFLSSSIITKERKGKEKEPLTNSPQ